MRALATVLIVAAGLRIAGAQQLEPGGASAGYMVFMRGAPVGREVVTVRSDAGGVTIASQGRLGPPFNTVTRNAEFRYAPDWTPQSFVLDGSVGGGDIRIETSFDGGTATSHGTQAGQPIAASHQVAPRTIVMPNGVIGSYVALARRLVNTQAGAELRAYVLPLVEVGLTVEAVADERMQIGTTFLDVRRYDLTVANPGGELAMTVFASSDGSLVRLSAPAQGLDIVRDDLAASTSRTQVYSNPGDEPVTIPAYGFNLGATLTRPPRCVRAQNAAAQGCPARLAAVVLLTGSGIGDRDGFALGIPTLGQLAGALAEAGFLVVRYDKRGHGQSGGRSESATLGDYAEDARAVVRWLANRKDVDPRRIAVVGHSEGAWVALLAAARERRIAAVATIAAASTTGAELVLEQQRYALDQMNISDAERQQRVALQKQILAAVATGKGWDGVPGEMRRAADTPWFHSVVTFDPREVIEDVRQPLLIVHGALDRQVPVYHADRLAQLAREESDSKSIAVVIVRGVNHLLVPAETGHVSEYGALKDRTVSADLTGPLSDWLARTFAGIR
ncbi:MAG TPA: alpha/beta fold hydrolase [Vicinamibacterales bacterium]|nr:alpha/beta fold hydrolase [Vicinamibacterales bacterium]